MKSTLSIASSRLGETSAGQPVTEYEFRFESGLSISFLNLGGIVSRLSVPAEDGSLADVVLGFEGLAGYLDNSPYFGAIIGRFGNRIGGDGFRVGDTFYPLAKNGGKVPELKRHLHGGQVGLSHRIWDAAVVERDGDWAGLDLEYLSPDGEEGYPGNLQLKCSYRIREDGVFRIQYYGTTDAPTHLNLTHHSYFNLAGHEAGSILEHEVKIAADGFVVIDEAGIPTGEIREVEQSPFDFRKAKTVGRDAEVKDEQLILPKGYDHNFVLGHQRGKLEFAASARDPFSGRQMEVWTDQPGIQFYAGNTLETGDIPTKAGRPYERHDGFCFETQHFPDSPNRPEFPSTLLQPGQTYQTTTEYRFVATEKGSRA
ncbi:MAG: aldose epimerase family protein [Puniceicoccaceae bacterium]